MFNILDFYRSRLFNKRPKTRQMKRRSRTISMFGKDQLATSNVSLNKVAINPLEERDLSSSSSKSSLNINIVENRLVNQIKLSSATKLSVEQWTTGTGATSSSSAHSPGVQNTLSFEADRFEFIMNSLTLSDEDQLANLLTEYFLNKEDPNMFSCSMSDETKTFAASFSSLAEFTNRQRRRSKRILNRCYCACIQAHMALAFKSMDSNFDNKLSFDEFSTGLRSILNEGCIKRLCTKSYQKIAINIVNDDAVLRRLFFKFDLNNDGYIDFSKI